MTLPSSQHPRRRASTTYVRSIDFRRLAGRLVAAGLRLEPQVGNDGVEHRLRHQESTGVIEAGDPAHAWRVTPGSLAVDHGSVPPHKHPGMSFARVVRGR